MKGLVTTLSALPRGGRWHFLLYRGVSTSTQEAAGDKLRTLTDKWELQKIGS